MQHHRIIAALVCAVVLAVSPSWLDAAPAAPAPAAPAALPISLNQHVKTLVSAEFDGLEKGADFAETAARLDALFDQVAATGTDHTLDALRDAAFARRLVHQLADVPADKRLDTLKYLRAHDTLARTLAFMIETTDAKGGGAAGPYAVLDQLREKYSDQLEKYATLTAALCVVHDRPFSRHVNENNTTAPPPADLFEFYTTYEKYMLFGLKAVPAELLVYVVDATTSIEDMKWALKKYAGDQAVGGHFFDVAYDHEHLRTGRPKKVTELGFTLPNILKYGGVCADQAFYAMSLGKSIGVPTAYASGMSGSSSHAWVGFLQARGDKGIWNFDVGRYPEYRGVRGEVLDPQTRKDIPDSYVSLLAELIGRKPADRQATVALADAAARIAGLEGGDFAPAAIAIKLSDGRSAPRAAGSEGALELLEMALNQNPGYPRAWFEVRDMAKSGKLPLPQKIKWSKAVLKLCGEKYPDFAAALLQPMIVTVEDPQQQNQLWEVAYAQFQVRKDLGAEIRMQQGKLWEENKAPTKAGICYMDVIEKYTNAGPFVIEALAGAERLLEGKSDKIFKLYEQTWAKTQKPGEKASPFMRQSNWYRVGTLYASKLKDAGQDTKADKVLADLGPVKAE